MRLYSVLEENILRCAGREAPERCGVEIAAVHVYGADAAVFVRRVVINAALSAAAGGIERDFVLAGRDLAAAAHLLDRAEDVEKLAELSGIANAEGTQSVDVMLEYDGEAVPFTLFSLPEEVNCPVLTAGRMPERASKVLADDHVFHEADIGAVFSVVEGTGEAAKERLAVERFTIVGLAKSPLYIGNDRGTTNIGSSSLRGFLYTMEGSLYLIFYPVAMLLATEQAQLFKLEHEATDCGISRIAEPVAHILPHRSVSKRTKSYQLMYTRCHRCCATTEYRCVVFC